MSQPDGSNALVIEKVGPEHAGEYTVTATNDQGSASSSAPLEVQGEVGPGPAGSNADAAGLPVLLPFMYPRPRV